MKRLLSVAVWVLTVTPLFAHSFALQNEENVPFHFVVVQGGSPQYDMVQRSLQGAVDVVSTTSALREMVPAFGVAPVPAGGGDSFLVGVFVYPGRSTYPVAVVPLSQEAGTVVVSRDNVLESEDGLPVTVRPWQVRTSSEPVILDNRYLDWEPFPALAGFSRPIEPLEFILETEQGRRTARIADSMFWSRGGTRLDTIKAVQSEYAIYLNTSTHDEFASGASLLMFVYGERGATRPAFTLEIPMTSSSGWVLLWLPGAVEPVVVGNYVRDAFILEAMIRFDLLGDAVPALNPRRAAVEFASMFSGAGRHEEFYHSRVYLSSIPVHRPAGVR